MKLFTKLNAKSVWQGLALRVKVVGLYISAFFQMLTDGFEFSKSFLVQRMFWGRGSWYKNSFHVVILGVTFVLVITGVLSRVQSGQVRAESLTLTYGAIGNNDYITQGSTITSVVAVEAQQQNYRVVEHTVKEGESLDDIAKQYSLTKDTIKWANSDALSPFNDNVSKGTVLTIPEMNGVLYKVEKGDTLESILDEVEGANRFDVVEINGLEPPKYSLADLDYVFVPNAELPAPVLPQPVYTPGLSGYLAGSNAPKLPLGLISFANPLTHPQCAGYVVTRGFLPWHDGADLAKGGGCPMRAAADGKVRTAGWMPGGAAYSVVIEHGHGVETHYYHGNGVIWVQAGQQVKKGQDIMYMGCSGNCTGTHLHLELRYQGYTIDPAPYIPY